MRTANLTNIALSIALVAIGCSSDPSSPLSPGGAPGTGGVQPGTGGAKATGGTSAVTGGTSPTTGGSSTATGGASAQGGSSTGGVGGSSGGIANSGGASTQGSGGRSTGGNPGDGGRANGGSFGTSGGRANGGSVGTSGGRANGGGPGTGGSLAQGGTSAGGSPATGGASAQGGRPASGGTGGGGGTPDNGKSIGASGLPDVGTGNVAQPAGAVGGFKILDWAGFKGAASYTFDDALASQVSAYSQINGAGAHVTFYIVQGNDNNNQIWKTAANDGHELGNHTAHHCQDNGSQCAWGTYAGSLVKEIQDNTAHIKQAFGVAGVYTMASPYGAAGYVSAAPQAQMFINRGVSGSATGVSPRDNTNQYSVPCYDMPDGSPASNFNTVIGTARSSNKWFCFLIHSINTSEGYRQVPIGSIVDSIKAAKTAGDVWIDTMVNVGAYWQGQKLLAGVQATTSGTTSTWTWTLPANFPPKKFLRVTVTGGKLTQNGSNVPWNNHGYYEISLDEKSLTLSQ